MAQFPEAKVTLTTANRETEALAVANLETILLRQEGLEGLQKIIERGTNPPATCSLSAISAAIAAALP